MKLRLVNFRCYKDKTFDFGENGLNLISSPSGAGKSSILIGIYFALYGTGQKVTNHGQTSCSVEFTFSDLNIIRSKKPNRLVVYYNEKKYEDDAAQSIINTKFGKEFSVIGYIAQNALNSFIVMSPTDKLLFLEKFAFNDLDLPDLKNRSKSLIQKRHDEFLQRMSQVQTIEQVLNEFQEPEKVDFPIKTANIERTIKNEEIRKRNCEKMIIKYTRDIEKIKNELNDVKVLNAFLKNKEENFENICSKLSLLSISEEEIIFIGDNELMSLKEKLKQILSLEELTTLKNQLDDSLKQLSLMKEKEISEYQTKIKNKEDVLWNEYTKEDCITFVNDLKDTKKDAEKISFLKKQRKNTMSANDVMKTEENIQIKKDELHEKKELLDMVQKKNKTYHCPSCSSSLIFENNKLYIEEKSNNLNKINDIDERELSIQIKKLKNEIENDEKKLLNEKSHIDNNIKIEQEINDIQSSYDEELNYESISDDLEQIQNYYKTHIVIENDLNKLKTNLDKERFSSSYSMFESKVERLKKSITELESKSNDYNIEEEEQYEEEELRNLIYTEQNKHAELKKINAKKIEYEKEKEKETIEHEKLKQRHIEVYKSINMEEKLVEMIDEYNNNLVEQNENLKLHTENLHKISLYNKYIEEKDKYQNWKKKLTEAKNEEEEIKNKYNASKLLLEKIIEAEYISMVNIVDNINLYSQNYLDSFFPDNPITVNLSCFKETKKNSKPQINIEISYKGMDCDISSLSGGETSRVILAFTLALGEMFNTPLLMLDECTASLDSESTSIVFDTIKENFKNKSVLVVAHQCTEGIFDTIIKIN